MVSITWIVAIGSHNRRILGFAQSDWGRAKDCKLAGHFIVGFSLAEMRQTKAHRQFMSFKSKRKSVAERAAEGGLVSP